MTQFAWIGKLVRRPSKPRAARRPRLECLEDRTLLTTGFAAGLLDPAFGTGGLVVIPPDKVSGQLEAVALQKDGKIVAAGTAFDGTHLDFAVARFNADGTLDTSFGKTGIVLTPFGNTDSVATGIAVQADGKIVVGGDNGSNFAVARYNTDGSLDTSFHHTGTLTTSFAGAVSFANGVALQSDGKIVVAGRAQVGAGGAAQDEIAVARYNADGSLDGTFHHTGQVLTDFGTLGSEAEAVAITPDGKIVAAGAAGQGTDSSFAVVEYNADGSLNTAFGNKGGITPSYGPLSRAAAVQVQPDGKVLVAGTNGRQFVVARYNADGSADSSFSGDGVAVSSFDGYGAATGMALGPNGNIVLGGLVATADSRQVDFGLAGFDSHGNPDTTLGPTGSTTTAFATDATVAGVAVQADGKIVVVGTVGGGELALARYAPLPPSPTPVATTTTLSTSAANAVYGQSVTLTATVTPAPVSAGQTLGELNGTVTFRDGDRVLGTVALVGSTTAQLTTTLGVGTHLNITATYSGNGAFAGSSSSPIAEQVNAATTTTTLVSSGNPSSFGQAVTYTAHVAVAAPGVGTPGGLVLFLDGASVLGISRLNASGTAKVTTRRTPGPGLHHVVAVYLGSPDYAGSQSAALTQRVRVATDTSLTLPAGPVTFGASVTLTARVTVDGPGNVKAGETVTFKDGTQTLGTGTLSAAGVATLTLNGGLAAGPHHITAVYAGDSSLDGSTSDSKTLNVSPEVVVPLGKSTARA